MPNQDSFEWIEGTFGLEPHWTRDPNVDTISQIVRKHLGLGHESSIDVTFCSQGTFNKLYKIFTLDSTYLMRVCLPIDPHHRTESTIATVELVRQNTSIPVPRIIASDSSSENELGFEWTLTDMIPGTTLHKAWRKLAWDAKERIVKQIVEHQAQLYEHRFHKIGNMYRQNDSFVVDRLVTTIFFQGDHLTHNVVRGPFTSSYDWLKERLQLILANQQRILETSCDEDELEDAELAHNLAKKLLEILPTVILPNVGASEPTVLFHDSLSMRDIMVDNDGKLTAIVYWECVSAVPLWRACQLPQMLEGCNRDSKPLKEDYSPDSEEEDDEDDDGLDNEGITDLYWDHLLEYEQTQLRKLFVQEMEKASPDWIAMAKQSTLKANFEKAVQDCDNGWRNKVVKRWVDSLIEGNPRDLTFMLHQQPDGDQANETIMDWEEA